MSQYAQSDLILNKDKSIYHLSLKPEHIADRIITVGDPGRVHLVSRHFDRVDFEMNRREFITHTGKYQGKKITVISSGMGTGNVEILMTELDAIVNIDLKKREPKARKRKLKIIRIGTSGAIQQDIPLDSHIMSEYAIGLDSLMHFYNFKQRAFPKEVACAFQKTLDLPYEPYCVKASDELMDKFQDIRRGNTLTCHGFYAPQGRSLRSAITYPDLVDKLMYFHVNDFWLTNLEMETAGYYAMSKLLGHKVVSMNAILANRVTGKFSKDPNKAVHSLIMKVLEQI